MYNNGQQWRTMDNNGQQRTAMDNNGQQWTTVRSATCIYMSFLIIKDYLNVHPQKLWSTSNHCHNPKLLGTCILWWRQTSPPSSCSTHDPPSRFLGSKLQLPLCLVSDLIFKGIFWHFMSCYNLDEAFICGLCRRLPQTVLFAEYGSYLKIGLCPHSLLSQKGLRSISNTLLIKSQTIGAKQ